VQVALDVGVEKARVLRDQCRRRLPALGREQEKKRLLDVGRDTS
jgi:hypothetical protein